ncbi:MAG: NAD(P)-dependent oxidoreductase [Acidobacteriota bacterium]
MRVAVVGAQGQLGAAVVEVFASGHTVLPLAHADLDIADDRAVASVMARLRPDAIVNCSGFNDVDGAEDRPVEALNVNAFAVRALAGSAAALGAALVHYGSDFVFDGLATAPYTEDDRPNPRSVYAASKLLGEWFAADAPRWYVLRVESLFGFVPGGRPAKGSVAAIVNQLLAGEEVVVFADRTVSPTYIFDAAAATRHLIERAAPSGLYHCVNSGAGTWQDVALEIARQLGVQPRLVLRRMADAALRAQRPQYCALSNRKLVAAGARLPTWQDAIARYVRLVRPMVTD